MHQILSYSLHLDAVWTKWLISLVAVTLLLILCYKMKGRSEPLICTATQLLLTVTFYDSHTQEICSALGLVCVHPLLQWCNINIFNYQLLQMQRYADHGYKAVISSVVMLFSQCVMCKSSTPAGRSDCTTHFNCVTQQRFIPERVRSKLVFYLYIIFTSFLLIYRLYRINHQQDWMHFKLNPFI